MKRRLEGKVAIVTGAGSRGEGWGNGMTIAILFAREGAQVLLVHRDEAVAQRTLSVIQEEGGSAAVYRGDVAIEGRGSAPAPRGWRAPRFFTARPCTTFLTASSTILPLLVRGMSATCSTLAGTWRGVVLSRIWSGGCADQRVVEHEPLAQLHEQHHAHVVGVLRRPVLADHDRFDHLGQLLDLAVDLGGADAHAARVQRGVRTAVDDQPAVRGDLAEVAVAPHVVGKRSK
jgi:hypothetical protein